MGASTFEIVASGPSAKAAFETAAEDARRNYGCYGYTGTIADKREYVIVSTPLDLAAAKALAETLIDACDKRIDDKRGPAGCIPLTDGRFFFFGWAPD